MVDHCRNVHICLIGENRFQHELLVSSLKEIRDCRCTFTTAASLADFSNNAWCKQARKRLVFLDCFNLAREELEPLLYLTIQKVAPENLMVLFNLGNSTGVETKALNFGVRGFFYSHDTAEDFCIGARAILRGEVRLSRKIMSEMLLAGVEVPSHTEPQDSSQLAELSPREKVVLCALGRGLSNDAIGSELCISPHTVRTHLCQVYKKIQVSSRLQAVLWAAKNLSDT